MFFLQVIGRISKFMKLKDLKNVRQISRKWDWVISQEMRGHQQVHDFGFHESRLQCAHARTFLQEGCARCVAMKEDVEREMEVFNKIIHTTSSATSAIGVHAAFLLAHPFRNILARLRGQISKICIYVPAQGVSASTVLNMIFRELSTLDCVELGGRLSAVQFWGELNNLPMDGNWSSVSNFSIDDWFEQPYNQIVKSSFANMFNLSPALKKFEQIGRAHV